MLPIPHFLRAFVSTVEHLCASNTTAITPLSAVPRPVVTDLTVCFSPPTVASRCHELNPRIWHRLDKDLYLHTSQRSAWLYVALANEEELTAKDLLVVDIRIGDLPNSLRSGNLWEGRPGGIWVRREKFSGKIGQAITAVDVLFGVDAVDPRPQWHLKGPALQVNAEPKVPVARLSVLHGRPRTRSHDRVTLRVREDGKFKVLQISDAHMVTGVGLCKDAIDACGNDLPDSEADPLTINFIETILDVEEPDLVVLTGDQLHHDIADSQSALLKLVAPIITRSIPFAAVFGNHDSEGRNALSRTAQMRILQNLPYSLCELGPERIDGIGNFYLQVLAPSPSRFPFSTLYFLDSHGQVPGMRLQKDYEPIKQSQIDWFKGVSRAQRSVRKEHHSDSYFHLDILFQHIPLPEFGDHRLSISSGCRGEPTESPYYNSHLYDALVEEGISALGCGHDHVNDFCGLLPTQTQQHNSRMSQSRPWLCYGGSAGFGGYCSYGKKRFHRRMRVWEFDAGIGTLKTWKRVEYATDKVDELVLVKDGTVVDIQNPN